MMTLTINRKNHTIEMPTKKYALAASKYGSDEYKEVQSARADYPNYKVVTRKSAKRSDNLKGLTYEVMESYIAAHDDAEGSNKKYYDFLRGVSEEKASSSSYGEIRKWFLKAYPTYGKYVKVTSDTIEQ